MMGVLLPTPLAFEDKIWQDSYTNTLGTFLEARYFITEKASLTLGSRFSAKTKLLDIPIMVICVFLSSELILVKLYNISSPIFLVSWSTSSKTKSKMCLFLSIRL